MEIWLSTHNDGKLREFKEILKGLPFEVHGAKELSHFDSPPETGETFVDNARIKAKALYSIKNQGWVVADDSGLVVNGLNGLPGVHSARYAGANARPSENNAKLLKMMQLRSSLKREAYFFCCLVAISPEGQELQFEGRMEGSIAKVAAGSGGFGYDPVFIPEGHEVTLAELSPGTKNQISHRARAMEKLLEYFQQNL